MARVASMLRIKALQDTVCHQAARLRAQLKMASKIQSLFWPTMPDLGGDSHMWALSQPAVYIGGDLYDVIPLTDGSLVVHVADVAGKGVAAALIMAALSVQIRAEAPRHEALEDLLAAVNRHFYLLAAEEGLFATIVLVRFWPADGRMHLTAAGHPPPLAICSGHIREVPMARGIALGAKAEARYALSSIQLSKGESLLLYSDGVTEAEDGHRNQFGLERILDHVAGAPGPPWGKGLLAAIRRWRGDAPVNDDTTLLEIWRGKAGYPSRQ